MQCDAGLNGGGAFLALRFLVPNFSALNIGWYSLMENVFDAMQAEHIGEFRFGELEVTTGLWSPVLIKLFTMKSLDLEHFVTKTLQFTSDSVHPPFIHLT